MKTMETARYQLPEFIQEHSPVAEDLLERMRDSLACGNFYVVYQPFLKVLSAEIAGVEALARWSDPQLGEISPSQFIPMAETNGFIHEFSEWMVTQVLREVESFTPAQPELVVALHISPRVLAQNRFFNFLNQMVPESRRGRVVIEVTDLSHLGQIEEESYLTLVRELVEQGFRFAIDDFGETQSDLRRIIQFPAHILKTDISLLRHPEYERRGNVVMSLVADVARELNMRVLAGGVESESQWEQVRKFGIAYAKGFHICPPITMAELKRWIHSVSTGVIQLPGSSHVDRSEPGERGSSSSKYGRPILLVDGEGSDWEGSLQSSSAQPVMRVSLENGSAMLEHFDLHLCIMCISKVSITHLEFLERRRLHQPDIPVIVAASSLNGEMIVRLMRGGVTDVILLPEKKEAILRRIQEHSLSREAGLRSFASSEHMARHLRERIEWESYKESRTLSADNRFGQKTIDHLRVSLTQGAGFGILLTIIEMMGAYKTSEEALQLLTPDLLRLLIENGQIAWKHIKGLEAIVQLMEKDFPLQKVSSREFGRLVTHTLTEISRLFRRRGLKLNLPGMGGWGDFYTQIEPSYFKMALQELAVNAYKYAVVNTELDIVTTLRAGYLCIGLKNIVSQEPYGGVPEDQEERVTEPFYRLRPPVEDAIEFETFGMGLGLTAVKYILHRHRGMISIKDVRDYSHNEIYPAVLTSLYIPVEAGGGATAG